MEFFRITQVAYQFLHLFGIAIFVVALVAALNWPPIRGRGLLVAALVLKLAGGGGYLLLGLLQMLAIFSRHGSSLSPAGLMQVGYLLLSVIALTGDGLLMAALLRLAPALRVLRPVSPANPPSPWQS